MTSLAVPSDLVGNRRPLSTHGLPKPPRVSSPERPHRFSALGFPHQSFNPDSASLRSPGPLSPPMSAKSFGTFIDSEPSTPAYSPRMDYDWDGSTLVLLRPMSSSSEPTSPTEPVWEMMSQVHVPQHNMMRSMAKSKASGVTVEARHVELAPAPPPTKRTKPAEQSRVPKETNVLDFPTSEDKMRQDSIQDEKAEHENTKDKKTRGDKPNEVKEAPLGKFASKMKSMLRRKSTNDNKKEKEKKKYKDYYDYDRMEDVHWSEY